jgi:hypothetical protein
MLIHSLIHTRISPSPRLAHKAYGIARKVTGSRAAGVVV